MHAHVQPHLSQNLRKKETPSHLIHAAQNTKRKGKKNKKKKHTYDQ